MDVSLDLGFSHARPRFRWGLEWMTALGAAVEPALLGPRTWGFPGIPTPLYWRGPDEGCRVPEEELPQQFQIELPPEVAVGVFADFASVWHTPNVFVMDFVALSKPPMHVQDEHTGESAMIIPSQVVSRIRIPPEQVFELAKALTQQLEAWEQETGRRPPARPLFDVGSADLDPSDPGEE